jgi:putative oxidoreductase
MDAMSFDPQTVLRVLCGVWFLPHCIGKIRNLGPASQTFAKAGLHPARTFVALTIVVEVIAGLGLAFNIYPKVAAGLAAGVLAGASHAVLKINGFNWRWQKQGPEYMIFWAIAALLSVSG